ncbi:MAG: hypothetical protein ACYSR5_01925 [Planctomycetota bacterium]|jgi:hypothetical protein
MEQRMDIIDILIKLGIFASFVIFGVAVWILKKERDKKRSENQDRTETP